MGLHTMFAVGLAAFLLATATLAATPCGYTTITTNQLTPVGDGLCQLSTNDASDCQIRIDSGGSCLCTIEASTEYVQTGPMTMTASIVNCAPQSASVLKVLGGSAFAYTNLAATRGSFYATVGGPDQDKWATGFTRTSGQDYYLTQATVELKGYEEADVGSFLFTLNTDVGGMPSDTVITSFELSPPQGYNVISQYNLTPSAYPALNPSATYWLVGAGTSASASIDWGTAGRTGNIAPTGGLSFVGVRNSNNEEPGVWVDLSMFGGLKVKITAVTDQCAKTC